MLCGGRSLHRGLEPAYYAADDLDLPRRGFEPISCVTSNHPPRSHVLTDFTCSPWWYTRLRVTQVMQQMTSRISASQLYALQILRVPMMEHVASCHTGYMPYWFYVYLLMGTFNLMQYRCDEW
jgi:hypothetical protein